MENNNKTENELSLEQRMFNMITLNHPAGTPFGTDKVEIMLKLADADVKNVLSSLTNEEFVTFLNRNLAEVHLIVADQISGIADAKNKDDDLERTIMLILSLKHLLQKRTLVYNYNSLSAKEKEMRGAELMVAELKLKREGGDGC